MKKLLLVDGNSLLFRAYYSTIYTNPLKTSNGIYTNAVYGFINTLNRAIRQVEPDALLVAWDAGQKTFRHDMMEEYKGTRKPLDPELAEQMPIVREFLDEAEITRYEQPGYEADDIIGSIAKAALDMQTYILTGDQDLLQLVDESTTVLMMKPKQPNPVEFTPETVEEVYGLKPIQIIDLKGLMGDASDNIPGVKGVGPKTAEKLLKQYSTIENTYEHLSEIKGAMKKKLEAGKESAFLSKELATIFTDVKVPFSFDDLVYKPNENSQANFYVKYEMQSLLSSMKSASAKETYKAEIVSTIQGEIDGTKPLFFLPLSDGSAFMDEVLYGFVLSQLDNSGKKKCIYISKEEAKSDPEFQKIFDNKEVMVWNAKKTWHLLDRYGFKSIVFQSDLHLAAFLLYSQATSTEALLQVLEIALPFGYRDLTKKSLGGFSVERNLDFFAAWAAQAIDEVTPTLEKLKKEDLDELYWQIEFPLARLLYQMEKEGIDINLEILKSIGEQYQAILDDLSEKIYALAGHEFNIGSPKQLGVVLFDELKLKSAKKRSTAAEILEKLKEEHPIVPLILEYRKYDKIVTTYVEGLAKAAVHGKIHTTFNQTMTQTGRLSSSDPNLQNISIKSEEGKEIRKAFVAPKGHILLSADYSQIELRILAHMANEQYMIQAFMEGVDIHNRTASLIFDKEPDEVDESERRIAKTVNFAIIYGQTEFGLSQELHISRLQAKQFIAAYLASYPRIHEYMESIVSYCKEHGYVKTLLNRRRAIPEINDKNFMTREFGKRAAMNAPIQGSAADLIKKAMLKVHENMEKEQMQSKMLLQIHDELIFDVPESELEAMIKLVQESMDSAMDLSVPLDASIHYGKDWYEAK